MEKSVKSKALSIVLCIVLLFTIVTGQVGATTETTNSFTVTVDSVEAVPGATVDVTVDLSKVNGGYRALDFAITYDGPITLTGVECEEETTYNGTQGQDVESLIVTTSEKVTDTPYVMQWAYVTSANVTYAGTIATLTFKVADDATVGTVANVNIAAYNKDGSLDVNGNPVAVEYVNGTVTVAEEEPECTHENAEWVVTTHPTRDKHGVKELNCPDCNTTLETGVAPRLLRFRAATLRLESGISFLWKLEGDHFGNGENGGFTNPYIVCEVNGQETVIDEYTIESSTGRYVFVFSGLTPAMMEDTITATAYAYYGDELCEGVATDYYGNAANGKYSTSVLAYFNSQISTTNSELRTLLVDLLNYGSAMQIYLNYNVDKLVNRHLTETQLAYGTLGDPQLNAVIDTKADGEFTNPTYKFSAVSLRLTDSVKFRLRVSTCDANNKTGTHVSAYDGFTAKVVSEKGNEWTLDSSNFEIIDGVGYFIFDGMIAQEFRTNFTFILYKDGVRVSNAVKTNVEYYCAGNKDVSTNGLGNLVKSVMKYGDAAYSYFN